ncbi:MAG: DUF2958 domain-containing protein [Verrucomicrobiales bacterium]|nr:DUF2958 domain-containing protein [Verrucomicrobiales bacterium]
MKLLTEEIKQQLIKNHQAQTVSQQNDGESIDFKPVVKLFTPDAAATWLLTELDPETNLAFGICDLGMGYPELGYVSMDEIAALRGKLGLPVERDLHFKAGMSLSQYHEEAVAAEHIVC